MASLLEQLKSFSTVVADTGDKASLLTLSPVEITTNPTLLLKSAGLKENEPLLKLSVQLAKKEAGTLDLKTVLPLAVDHLSVEIGSQLLALVPGRVSTEVDARLSYDTIGTIKKAHRLIELYQKKGVARERILIKIAATHEGIVAAEYLERQGIHCNLTLLFDLYQAAACAHAKVTLISPFVGRILDWHKAMYKDVTYAPSEDPGVVSVRNIYNYLKHYDYKTAIMAASFRNLDEIIELVGCDLLTIAPNFLQELSKKEGVLARKLSIETAQSIKIEKIEHPLRKQVFDVGLASNKMATDKLLEGVNGFIQATVDLEAVLAHYFE